MAVARQELLPPPLTYEEYLAEGETLERYDIIDGVREVTNPTRKHQRLLRRVARALEDFEEESGLGQCIVAPCDILIRRSPLRTRQPDVLFISCERLAQARRRTTPLRWRSRRSWWWRSSLPATRGKTALPRSRTTARSGCGSAGW